MEKKNFVVGKLKVRVFDTREEMGKNAAIDVAARINRIIKDKGEANVVFAAAPSQNELLENLKQADVDWTKVRAFHLDEYIDLPADHPAWFSNFLDKALFKELAFKEVYYMRDTPPCADGRLDPEAVANRYTQLMEKFPPDLVFLGIGENGHIAFNDPPVADFNDPLTIKLIELDETCRNQQLNDGPYSNINEVPRIAMTMTVSALLKIPEHITVVPGPRKADAVFNTLLGPISTECPASILREHNDSTLYLDVESAEKIITHF